MSKATHKKTKSKSSEASSISKGRTESGRAVFAEDSGNGAMSLRSDALLQTALWYRNLRESNNDTFMPLFFDTHRYLVLKGGGGSGKSIFAGRKVLERATTEPGHRVLVCRKVARTLRESCFEQLKDQAYEYYADSVDYIPKGKNSDMYMRFKNGSEIIFAGLDDVEKLKSIFDITLIWIEEGSELEEGDFNQLDIRLRTDFPYYLQMILSFNPISITHWLKKRFFDRKDPRARVHESTYKDNRFLIPEAIQTLEAYKETDLYYYMVYCLGQWGVTGKTVFNGKAVSERLEHLPQPVKTGHFEFDLEEDGLHIREESIRWVDAEEGAITIFEEPEPGRPYVIGGDTAGDGSDWFVGQVLDNISGRQVCVLRHQYDEDTYARQMFCLGRYYNMALIGIEVNHSTYPVKILDLMGYRKLFVREVEDSFDGKIRHAFGFRTDRLTRPVILSDLIRLMRDHLGTVNHEETLLEMLTFVYNEKQRPEAEPGAHDDCILALAIAHYIRPQQNMRVETERRSGTAHWTADMWEDYNRASTADKEMLRRRWGG